MSLVYGIFGKNGIVVEEYVNELTTNNAVVYDCKRAVEQILFAMPKGFSGNKSYEHEGLLFNYTVEKEFVFLCVLNTKDPAVSRASFELLRRLFDVYNQASGDVQTFRQAFKKEMSSFTATGSRDNNKVHEVQEKLSAVTDLMRGNIEKVLDRGEKLESVVAKTEGLATHASAFRSRTVDLKRKICLQNAKTTVILVIVVIFVALFLAMSICGVSFSCARGDGKHHDRNSTSSEFF